MARKSEDTPKGAADPTLAAARSTANDLNSESGAVRNASVKPVTTTRLL